MTRAAFEALYAYFPWHSSMSRRMTSAADIACGADVIRLAPEVFLSALLLQVWEPRAKVFGTVPLEQPHDACSTETRRCGDEEMKMISSVSMTKSASSATCRGIAPRQGLARGGPHRGNRLEGASPSGGWECHFCIEDARVTSRRSKRCTGITKRRRFVLGEHGSLSSANATDSRGAKEPQVLGLSRKAGPLPSARQGEGRSARGERL